MCKSIILIISSYFQSLLINRNAIRGLLMHLCQIPPSKIHSVEIPTGLPLVYDWKQGKIRLLEDHTLQGRNPLDKYNFGSAPELLFKTKKDGKGEGVDLVDLEEVIIKDKK
jgi:hypothetical protein